MTLADATSYDGRVEPDGVWQDRRDGALHVRKFSVEEMDNNIYLIRCSASNEGLLVDAAARADRIRQAIADVDVRAVVQTHGHWDHVRAWGDLKEDPGLPIWGHPGDQDLFPHPLDRELADGEVINVGLLRIEVLHIPGHTPGSCSYLVHGDERDHLFTGDTLFPGGPGNTFGNADAFTQIMDGLQARVFGQFDDRTWIYPGHGNDTTLGRERPHVEGWRERGW